MSTYEAVLIPCIIILLIFLIASFVFSRKIRLASNDIKSAINFIQSIKPKQRIDEDEPSTAETWRPDLRSTFIDRYSSIDEEISKNITLRNCWKKYSRNMQFPGIDFSLSPEIPPRTRNTSSLDNVFSFENVLSPLMNIRRYTSLPNKLAGAGLLFTFVGLCIGIFNASEGLSSDNIETTRNSLSPLLSGAAMAFTTSVCGLSLSMIFSLIEKTKFHNIEICIKDFVRLLDERIEYIDSHKLAHLKLEAIQYQTKVLSSFQLDQQRITDETITRVSREFREAMTESAGSELNKLGEMIASMSDRLDQSLSNLSENHKTIQSSTHATVQKMEDALIANNEALIVNYKNIESKEELRLNGIKDCFNSMIKTINSSTESNSKKINDTAKIVTEELYCSLGSTINEKLIEFVEKTTSSIDDSMRIFRENIELSNNSISTTIQSIPETLNRLEEINKQFSIRQNEQIGSQKGTIELLDNLKFSAEYINSTASHLSETNDKCIETNKSFSKIAKQIERSFNLSNDNLALINDSQALMDKNWKNHEERFSNLDQSIERSFVNLQDGLKSYTAQTNIYIKSLDDHTSKISSHLIEAVNEIQEKTRLPISSGNSA
ncbi:MAG: hypothetical protein V7739_20770 [Motiliproteus sp.]